MRLVPPPHFPVKSRGALLRGGLFPPLVLATALSAESGEAHLLSVLLEEAQLEALVQFQLPDVPHLMEVLPGGVELIQQTGHLPGGNNGQLLDEPCCRLRLSNGPNVQLLLDRYSALGGSQCELRSSSWTVAVRLRTGSSLLHALTER